MSELVSVIIPSYNHADFIVDAVRSVLDQSYDSLELILIDDGSTDNTLERIKGIADDRIKLFVQENSGAARTINRGLEIATGEYISILNSDDSYHPTRVERLVGEARQHRDALLFFTDFEIIGTGSEKSDKIIYYQKLKSLIEHSHLLPYEMFLYGNIAFTTSNYFFRKDVPSRIGFFRNLKYTHDWDWAFRSSLCGEVIWIKERLLNYRVHEKNTISDAVVHTRGFYEDNFIIMNHLMDTRSYADLDVSCFIERFLSLINANRFVMPYVALLWCLVHIKYGSDMLLEMIQNDAFIERINSIIASNNMESLSCNYHVAELARYQDGLINQRDKTIRKLEADYERVILETQAIINSMKESWSWKLTRPLRMVRDSLDKIDTWLKRNI